MVRQAGVGHAERSEHRREAVARVVTDKNLTAVAATLDQIEGRGLIRTNEFGDRQDGAF
jgi:hypothetical protein